MPSHLLLKLNGTVKPLPGTLNGFGGWNIQARRRCSERDARLVRRSRKARIPEAKKAHPYTAFYRWLLLLPVAALLRCRFRALFCWRALLAKAAAPRRLLRYSISRTLRLSRRHVSA